MERPLNQAIAIVRGEVVRDADGHIALRCERRLIRLGVPKKMIRAYKQFRKLSRLVGSCVVLLGYPRFHFLTDKLHFLSVTQIMPIRVPHGQFRITGALTEYDGEEGEITIQIKPEPRDNIVIPPFDIRIAGFLPNANVGDIWFIEAELCDGLLEIVDAERLRSCPAPPILKQRHRRRRRKSNRKPDKPKLPISA